MPWGRTSCPEVDVKGFIRFVVTLGLNAGFGKAGGGGGYGDPNARPVAAVLDDVRNELISVERARSDYGVAVDTDTLEVDVGETETLRGKNR